MSSSRRANGEISILAMLDGQSRRSLSKRFPALPALLGYAAAGTAACALVGVLAWLAHEGMDGPGQGRNPAVVAEAATRPPAIDAGDAGDAGDAHADADAATATAPAPAPPDIADAAAAPGAARHGPDTPPLAGRAAIVDALAAAPASRSAALTAPNVPTVPTMPTTSTASSATAASMPSTAAHAPAPAPKSVAVRTAAYRPPQGAARPDTRNAAAPRPRRTTPPAKPAVAAPDLDVALITAIIQHAGRPPGAGALEPADATCAGKPCGPRMPEQP